MNQFPDNIPGVNAGKGTGWGVRRKCRVRDLLLRLKPGQSAERPAGIRDQGGGLVRPTRSPGREGVKVGVQASAAGDIEMADHRIQTNKMDRRDPPTFWKIAKGAIGAKTNGRSRTPENFGGQG